MKSISKSIITYLIPDYNSLPTLDPTDWNSLSIRDKQEQVNIAMLAHQGKKDDYAKLGRDMLRDPEDDPAAEELDVLIKNSDQQVNAEAKLNRKPLIFYAIKYARYNIIKILFRSGVRLDSDFISYCDAVTSRRVGLGWDFVFSKSFTSHSNTKIYQNSVYNPSKFLKLFLFYINNINESIRDMFQYCVDASVYRVINKHKPMHEFGYYNSLPATRVAPEYFTLEDAKVGLQLLLSAGLPKEELIGKPYEALRDIYSQRMKVGEMQIFIKSLNIKELRNEYAKELQIENVKRMIFTDIRHIFSVRKGSLLADILPLGIQTYILRLLIVEPMTDLEYQQEFSPRVAKAFDYTENMSIKVSDQSERMK